MNVEKIDWDNAPEDAQYCQDGRWYKIENNCVFTRHLTNENAQWIKSAWNVDDDLDNDPDFIKRPVSSEQTVSAEVETTISTETRSIEPKPPLGLTPKNIWEEDMKITRRQDIHAAMQRYIEAGKEIPNNWLEELLELNNAIGIIKAQEILAVAKQNIKEEMDMDVEQPDNINEGWIEWGKNEMPFGLHGKIIEREYNDGEYRKGRVDDFTWNVHQICTDGDTVKRYRVVGETE